MKTAATRAQALAAAAHLQRPLVFTNGVFDLLHAGHARLLAQARALGAALVVGVNSDASVRLLGKGADRPLQPQDDRLALVAALESVSLAVLFDEPTPAALIDALRPEVYVKGGDYTLARLPEASQVLAWGGRAAVLPFLEGRSTTALVARIRAGTGGVAP
jgi:rfaE bifunctional protein nucleotidyltransferase chain/domain